MKNNELSKEVNESKCGDIVIITKVNSLQTGDTISSNKEDKEISQISLPKPQIYFAILPKNKGDEEKVRATLNKILERSNYRLV